MDMLVFGYKSYVTNYNVLHSNLLLYINEYIIDQIFIILIYKIKRDISRACIIISYISDIRKEPKD